MSIQRRAEHGTIAPAAIVRRCTDRASVLTSGGSAWSSTRQAGAARARIGDAIDEHAPGILAVAKRIRDRPGLGFVEHFAVELLTVELARMGYAIEWPPGGLPTAFRATRHGRAPGPTVAVLAEYDALPNLGHGRGHNLISAAALAAAMGMAPVLDQLSGPPTIAGTPAEEGGGGKIYLQAPASSTASTPR